MFKRGDIVKSEHTKNRGKVLYGPFTPGAEHLHQRESYLVELLEGEKKGMAAVWPTYVMTVASKFEVGQRVTFQYSPVGEFYELVAGPFPDYEGDPMWVLKDKNGAHDTSWEDRMVPVVE